MKWCTIMSKEAALDQYNHEVSLFERYGQKNLIGFEEWCFVKRIKIE